jgi:hypothetical protein
MVRNIFQEMRELGLRGTAFRVGWELKVRSDWLSRKEERQQRGLASSTAPSLAPWSTASFFPSSHEVREAMAQRFEASSVPGLLALARDATHGRILCFGRWTADFGNPIDWRLNPVLGRRWPNTLWTQAMRYPDAGDIKLTWEVARFPQAYWMARAATHVPEASAPLAEALGQQCLDFIAANPRPLGVHWASGQEIAIRVLAWLFAEAVVFQESATGQEARARALHDAGCSIEANVEYARIAVYNNHLLGEAVGLYALGGALDGPDAQRWRTLGRALLDESVERQFYDDGGYLQQSHSYHRVALTYLLWGCRLAQRQEGAAPARWMSALEKSLDHLLAQQNPADGRLPNYGSNDGSAPVLLDTCDYADFRPLLQTLSCLTRGERLFAPGPWDEMPAWLLGRSALELPVRSRPRLSRSFATSGHHVLRGTEDGTFATFHCGSFRDRFGQMDMLHVDVFWRGQNVLVDGGSYLYNGAAKWHDHFLRTGSHNTVQVDDAEQMLHFRRFKTLYPTRAQLLDFAEDARSVRASGEHLGFEREAPGVVHRRSVLLLKQSGVVLVLDEVRGPGAHRLRLRWLGGDFPTTTPFTSTPTPTSALVLETPAGPFGVQVFAVQDAALTVDVVRGSEQPPRGWQSRYYGEKVPVPSLEARVHGPLPQGFLSVLGPPGLVCARAGSRWELRDGGQACLSFEVRDGTFQALTWEAP